ncbi:GNAT family N-acetyltransferase [Vibrio methylphosphonaticus]|uniref:GNAT family N-acetyltransferase n=1 Tax=Vibrio methylphosphonaticus TaxID=2946866 RepID=UPI00202A17BF|nr:GNAT family N-acetyltransferase [Vibrio methylphosphonaticus]MCL9776482.1 GNAT family N-acetyltransferase [Vibrio methylphosphonaticus]
MLIREGSLKEVADIVATIDEFSQKETEESLASRLNDKRSLVLVAESNGELLGFKIGYEIDGLTFYSWFGGVTRHARRLGVAQALLEWQENWVSQHAYQMITVKSRNQFPSMLRLLIKNDYLIEGYEHRVPLVESRIMFIKTLVSGNKSISN